MGDMADYEIEQHDYPDPDGMEELAICPKCGYTDCFVDVNWRLKCPKCGHKEKL